jgi:hypothetical protein
VVTAFAATVTTLPTGPAAPVAGAVTLVVGPTAATTVKFTGLDVVAFASESVATAVRV